MARDALHINGRDAREGGAVMPKETIYRDVYFSELEDSLGVGTAHITTLRVGWDEARGIEIQTGYEERPATRKSPDHEIVLGEEPPIDSPTIRFICSYVDRKQANLLIRTLRRARDSVFGADE